jgi:hypothetical protein
MSESEGEDKMLMARLASGDTSALDKLYRKHWRAIDAFVRGKLFGVLSDTDASDIVQNTFCRIQRKAYLYKPSGTVLSWMRKITQNIIIDIVRQHLSRRRRETNYALARPPQGGEVEGPGSLKWEHGDPVNAPGGLSGKDVPPDGDFCELYSVEAPSNFVVVPRGSGGDILVWIGSFPRRVTKWGRTDRGRRWMRGGGADDVRGMFRCYGLVPEEDKKKLP